MKKWLILAVFIAASPAFGATTTGGHPACFSEEAFDEALTALTRNDEEWWQQLVASQLCFVPKSGVRVQRLDGIMGTCKLRLFAPDGSGSVVVWTPCENYTPD